MTAKTVTTLELDDAEVRAVLGWAGMAGVGFRYGGVADPDDPGVTALAKLEAAAKGNIR